MQFKELERGGFGLVRLDEEGTIRQVGLTQSQSDMLHIFLATISQSSKLIILGEKYDLDFKKRQVAFVSDHAGNEFAVPHDVLESFCNDLFGDEVIQFDDKYSDYLVTSSSKFYID